MRRIIFIVLMSLVVMSANASTRSKDKKVGKYFLFVGAYSSGPEEGIYLYEFDPGTGSLRFVRTTKGVQNPSYLAINPAHHLLVAVNETESYQNTKSGAVTSFQLNEKDGTLTPINQVASGGGSPCYVSINRAADKVLVANYSGGNVAMFPVSSHGKLGIFSSLDQHTGTGPVADRQEKAHAHCFLYAPDERFAFAVDLGTDQIYTYPLQSGQDNLRASEKIELDPGTGPRHLTFHPNGKLAFLIAELNSTITSLRYDAEKGTFNKIMKVGTLPSDFKGQNTCADIHVSPDGKFLYGSNRGDDSIVIFAIDEENGTLTLVGHHSSGGKIPRNFAIDPTGNFLLTANQDSNNVVVFKRDQKTGLLINRVADISVSKPVCLKFMNRD